jgi:hypothetical protein
MAINPKEFYLFASNRGVSAMPGVKIRYVELKPGCTSAENVRIEAQKNRIFSTWQKDR